MTPTPIFRRLASILPGLVLVLSLAVSIYDIGGIASGLQNQVFDIYQRILPRQAAPGGSHAVYVDIGPDTAQRYGAWPWAHKRVSQLVEAVAARGPSAILIDTPLSTEDVTSPEELLKLWEPLPPELQQTNLGAELGKLPDQDAALGALLARTPSVVSFVPDKAPLDIQRAPESIAPIAPLGGEPRHYAHSFDLWQPSLNIFEHSAKGNGTTMPERVPGTTVRALPMLLRFNNTIYPSNVLEALRVAHNANGYHAIVEEPENGFALAMEPGISLVAIDGTSLTVKTTPSGYLRLYFGDDATRQSIAAWKFMEHNASLPSLAGKIAIIGISVNGAEHLYDTATGMRLASGTIAANAIDQIIDGTFLIRPGWASASEQMFILLGGILVILVINRFRFRWGFFVAFVLICGVLYGSWYLFQAHRWLVDPAAPAATLILAAVVSALMRRLHTEEEVRFVEIQFARRLSSASLAKIRANPYIIQSEGALRDISSVVAGLRGFNIIADRYLEDPKAYADILNRFFTPMTKIVEDRNGMIDRAVGDTLYAAWNAPLKVSDHASKGCDAALRMVENLEALNEFLEEDARRQHLSHVPLSLSIGIDSGTAIIGNMGADQRFDYGVLGEPVSFAAYLQKNARNYGPAIIAGEGAQRVVGNRYALLEIDLISTPRHPEGRRVFALLGDPIMRANPKFRALQEAHTLIFAAYRNQRWEEANTAIAECRKLNGAISTLYDFYKSRIAHYQAEPPGDQWNGAWFAGRI